jgi:hypothetical protein
MNFSRHVISTYFAGLKYDGSEEFMLVALFEDTLCTHAPPFLAIVPPSREDWCNESAFL